MRRLLRIAALLASSAALAGPSAAVADEPAAAPKKVREATAEELPPLLADLEAAGKKKKSADALALLAKLEELKHPELEKPLQKLLKHAEAAVALRAAELLEERTYPESGKALWAASWGQAANDTRPMVRARVLRALGRIGFALDKRAYDDVEKLWRQVQGTPQRGNAPILCDIAFFAEQLKDKRFARALAEALDEPVSTSNDASNPPAAWWEEKWHLWDGSKAAVHAALKALTGEDFASTEKAKEWIEAHAKEGFAW